MDKRDALEVLKKEITEVNKKIYDRTDEKINRLYDTGRKISLEYFETIYKKLGTKFDYYFFESKEGVEGKGIVEKKVKITKVLVSINADILGGFKLRVGDEIWDESILGKIQQVKEAIKG